MRPAPPPARHEWAARRLLFSVTACHLQQQLQPIRLATDLYVPFPYRAHPLPQLPLRNSHQTSPALAGVQVGNQFVSQYYTVQHASPKHLHRFYSDASTLTFGDVRPDGFFSKNAIGQKVGPLGCAAAPCPVRSIRCAASAVT